jgi:hypothetical protein
MSCRVGAVMLGVLALALPGCVVFQSPPKAKQVADKPVVAVRFTLCGSSNDPGTACPNLGNSGSVAAGVPTRILVGFRVPRGTKLPRLFKPKRVAGVAGATPASAAKFRRSPAYKRELNRKAPRNRAKFKWYGYESDPIQMDEVESSGRLKVRMRLPKDFAQSTFKVRPVVGSYQGTDAHASFDGCGPDVFELQSGEDQPRVICIDDPSPQGTRKSIRVPISVGD